MTVSFRLRELLDAKRMTQSELARLSGVSFATINRLCTNATTQVSLDVLDRLCSALGVKAGKLLDRNGEPQ